MKEVNQIFSLLIPTILLSMGLEYIEHGHLGMYNFWKWLIIGILLGIGKVSFQHYTSNKTES